MKWIVVVALALAGCGDGGNDEPCYDRSTSGGVTVVTPCR